MEARDLRRYYRADTGLFARKGTVRAVDGVSFTLQRRPDLGGRREVGLRQVDPGAHGDAAGTADGG